MHKEILLDANKKNLILKTELNNDIIKVQEQLVKVLTNQPDNADLILILTEEKDRIFKYIAICENRNRY